VWGDNADFAGENRFLIGLLKDRIAQLMNKKVVMLAVSPGPFKNNSQSIAFAREVFENFEVVTNRESLSKQILENYGFNTKNVQNLACPSWLFKGCDADNIGSILSTIKNVNKPIIGMALCGWNMIQAPFSKWPRDKAEYNNFVELVEYLIKHLDIQVVLFSHSNGFVFEPSFKLIHGRDFPLVKQLHEIILSRNNIPSERLSLLTDIYTPKETKAIIGQFDMLISGRIHGAVAGLSQYVPTLIIDYGHEPKAHKIEGFAKSVSAEQYIAKPNDAEDMKNKAALCWKYRIEYSENLKRQIPKIQELARLNFSTLKEIVNKDKKG